MFSHGATSLIEFFQLPDVHDFPDVEGVANHNFVTDGDAVAKLDQGGRLPPDYRLETVIFEPAIVSCAVDSV